MLSNNKSAHCIQDQMEEDFARVKVAMSNEIGDGTGARRVGEGAREGVGEEGVGEEGGQEGGDARDAGEEGEKPGLKSMLVIKGEGRVRKRSTVSVRTLPQIHPQYFQVFIKVILNIFKYLSRLSSIL